MDGKKRIFETAIKETESGNQNTVNYLALGCIAY